MNKSELEKQLTKWIDELPNRDRDSLIAHLKNLKSIYPFNEYEYRLMFLLNKEIISFPEYEKLRGNYVSTNPFLYLYNLSPRVFGEIWAQEHITKLNARFQKPKKEIDKNYKGDYDLCVLNNDKLIRIEIKASRAINTEVRGGLETKALSFSSKDPYWMNFQQLKFGIADYFIFIGVWTDKILYWLFTNKEAQKHPIMSHQHRGGIEFQIGITNKNINTFSKFLVEPGALFKKIVDNSIK